MLTYKKRISVFLAVFVLGSIISVCIAQSIDDSPKSPPDTCTSSLPANDPNFWAGSGGFSTQELFSKMIFSVLLVVVLGAAAIYILKKFVPRISNLAGKRIRICETVHLGPRRTIHLIKIDRRTLLVGSTNENITTLADLTDYTPQADLPFNETDDK